MWSFVTYGTPHHSANLPSLIQVFADVSCLARHKNQGISGRRKVTAFLVRQMYGKGGAARHCLGGGPSPVVIRRDSDRPPTYISAERGIRIPASVPSRKCHEISVADLGRLIAHW
jgi:hypothetical protein